MNSITQDIVFKQSCFLQTDTTLRGGFNIRINVILREVVL